MLGHPFRTVRTIVVGLFGDEPAQVFDPVRRQRVAAEIREAAGVGEDLLRAEILEEADQTAAGFARVLKGAGAGVVSFAFLMGHVAQGA